MTSIEISHFAHVLAFAIVLGVDLPAFYAAKRAAAPSTSPDARLLAARVTQWSNALSSAAMALFLPLGLIIGANLGVYAVKNPNVVTVLALIGLAWFALVIITEILGQSALGKMLYTIEIWVRGLIGLSCIYDGITAFAGTNGQIQTNWLALKILLLGLVLLASCMVRLRLQPVRAAIAQINPLSAQMAQWDPATAQGVSDALKRVRPLVHSIFLFVLIAAWMGITKSW